MSAADDVALLVTVRGNVVLLPTSTVPKSNVPELRETVDGLESPATDTNSSDVFAFEEISTALARVAASVAGCGVKTTEIVQVAPARSVAQLLVAAKSVEV